MHGNGKECLSTKKNTCGKGARGCVQTCMHDKKKRATKLSTASSKSADDFSGHMIENVIKELHLSLKSYNTALVFVCFVSHSLSLFQIPDSPITGNRIADNSIEKESNKPVS